MAKCLYHNKNYIHCFYVLSTYYQHNIKIAHQTLSFILLCCYCYIEWALTDPVETFVILIVVNIDTCFVTIIIKQYDCKRKTWHLSVNISIYNSKWYS